MRNSHAGNFRQEAPGDNYEPPGNSYEARSDRCAPRGDSSDARD